MLAGGDKMKANIVIEKDEYGYYAFCPELKGCHSQGDSLDDVLLNIKEAIELYLETLSDEERAACLSKEILTTSLEVNVA
jgi:predicted RNase H-like HicB family nuclease